MNTIVIGICDDQESAVCKLKEIVYQWCLQNKRKVEIFTFFEGEGAIQKMQQLNILFLDIEMPYMDGIEVGKQFLKKNKECRIIMATGHDDRFKESFKINAFRFISKPYQIEEIEEALESCFKRYVYMSQIQLYENRIMHEIQQKNILYIEAYSGYIEAKVGNVTMRRDCSLVKMESILNSDLFFKVNKGCIVNLMKIDSYTKGMVNIKGKAIPVARRRRKEFEIAFQKYDLEFGGG